METFRDVLALWPKPTALASDIGKKPDLIRQWKKRNSIPSEHWAEIIEAAAKRGYELDAMTLANLATRRPELSA